MYCNMQFRYSGNKPDYFHWSLSFNDSAITNRFQLGISFSIRSSPVLLSFVKPLWVRSLVGAQISVFVEVQVRPHVLRVSIRDPFLFLEMDDDVWWPIAIATFHQHVPIDLRVCLDLPLWVGTN